MFRTLRRMPFFKLLALAEVAMLARRQVMKLEPSDRGRLAELVRRGPRMSSSERDELRGLLGKLEPRAFALAAARAFSPVPFWGRRRR